MYITSHYGIVTVKIAAPKLNHKKKPNTNRRYRYRILKIFYRLNKKYNTEIHSEQIVHSQTMYFQLFIAIYLY